MSIDMFASKNDDILFRNKNFLVLLKDALNITALALLTRKNSGTLHFAGSTSLASAQRSSVSHN